MTSEEQKSAEWWKFCLGEVNDKLNETIQQKIELRKEVEELKQKLLAYSLPNVKQALLEAHDTAMQQTLKARTPESGKFGAIAQNLNYAVSVLYGDE